MNKDPLSPEEVNITPSDSEFSPEPVSAEEPEPEIESATEAPEEKPVRRVSSFRVFLSYWLLFFAAIFYWEFFFGCLTRESVSGINYWFVVFAVPQAALLASLCGWGRDRLNRIIAAVLVFALFAFYTAQFIFFRAFGSVISLSMIGVGGDAMDDFGWAMMVTIKESIWLLLLLALPVILTIVWAFLRKPTARKLRFLLRPLGLAAAVGLWLLAGPILRLGGTQESSAYQAYVSSLVDADTSSMRIGVLTTTIMDLRTSLAGEEYEHEIATTVSSAASSESLEVPKGTGGASSPLLEGPKSGKDGAAGSDPAAEPAERSLNIIEEIDFSHLATLTDQESVKSLCEYLASTPGTNKNEYTGMLEGYNVIFVCAESFCSYAISEKVTPTLYKMANEGIVLTNFYNSFKNTTTNGEFAFMTGLWPDVSRKADKGVTTGSFGQSVKNFMPYGLGNVFSELGVKSFAFHNYLGKYYGRAQTHKNLGFKCKFMGEMKFTNRWPSSDLEMMEQSVDDFIHEDRFNVYYMTFSGHGPYRTDNNAISKKNSPKVPKTLNGQKLDPIARCYIANNLELEYSMQYLMKRLEEEGKLDKTLIVLVGDHYPYYLTDRAAKSILGKLPEKNFERYRSTCIMWFAGKEPIICDTPCCNVDILPTVLNLLGLKFDSRLLSGTDIFSDSPHAAMLYNKNFITDMVKYNAADGSAKWLIDASSLTNEQKQTYVDSVYSILKAKYAAALSINKLDFYRFVWDNSFTADEGTGDAGNGTAGGGAGGQSGAGGAGANSQAQLEPGAEGAILTEEEKRFYRQ